jgi:hypothetical protein
MGCFLSPAGLGSADVVTRSGDGAEFACRIIVFRGVGRAVGAVIRRFMLSEAHELLKL